LPWKGPDGSRPGPPNFRSGMEKVTIRSASAADAGALAELRVALAAEGAGDHESVLLEGYTARCRAFFAESIAAGSVQSWLAISGERPVAAASLELRWTFPRLRSSKAPDARIRSVFVRPECRRRGIAAALTRACIEAAQRSGVDRLTVGPSEMGESLYASLGFVLREREMVYVRPGSVPAGR
jgi:GNAT superfamily N-acetyltransferase